MLKKILQELKAISTLLEAIYGRLIWWTDYQMELEKLRAETKTAAVETKVEGKDPDAWMHAGIANILGYQPGKSSKEGEE